MEELRDFVPLLSIFALSLIININSSLHSLIQTAILQLLRHNIKPSTHLEIIQLEKFDTYNRNRLYEVERSYAPRFILFSFISFFSIFYIATAIILDLHLTYIVTILVAITLSYLAVVTFKKLIRTPIFIFSFIVFMIVIPLIWFYLEKSHPSKDLEFSRVVEYTSMCVLLFFLLIPLLSFTIASYRKSLSYALFLKQEARKTHLLYATDYGTKKYNVYSLSDIRKEEKTIYGEAYHTVNSLGIRIIEIPNLDLFLCEDVAIEK